MEFYADLKSLHEMSEFIKEQAIASGLQKDEIRKLELASEEAIVNIVSYAYNSSSSSSHEKKIYITCEKQGNTRFDVIFRDRGVPFNPLAVNVDAEIHKPLQERKVGGLGIYLIEQLMDEVAYKREGSENILRLSLHI